MIFIFDGVILQTSHTKLGCQRVTWNICISHYTLCLCQLQISTLPLCVTDEKVKISVVFDRQLVITVAYSVTNKSSLSFT